MLRGENSRVSNFQKSKTLISQEKGLVCFLDASAPSFCVFFFLIFKKFLKSISKSSV